MTIFVFAVLLRYKKTKLIEHAMRLVCSKITMAAGKLAGYRLIVNWERVCAVKSLSRFRYLVDFVSRKQK